jgi:hypothetical protein
MTGPLACQWRCPSRFDSARPTGFERADAICIRIPIELVDQRRVDEIV